MMQLMLLIFNFNEISFLSNIKKLDLLCTFFKNKIISVNLSRKRLSNIHMIDLLEKCFNFAKKNLVFEVEVTDYVNNFNHILQTVSTADIINKQIYKEKYKI